jgi:hypothetical protein
MVALVVWFWLMIFISPGWGGDEQFALEFLRKAMNYTRRMIFPRPLNYTLRRWRNSPICRKPISN